MNKKKIFLSFWAFIVYVLILFAIGTLIFTNYLNAYLAEYEQYQPTTLTDEVLSHLESKNTDALLSLKTYGDTLKYDTMNAYLDRFVDPDTLFCYRSSVNADTLVYDYISNNLKIASLTLNKTNEKSKRGFAVYEIEAIKWYPLMKYTVSAPESCTVYINKKPLDISKATKTVKDSDTAYESFDGYVYNTVEYDIEYLEYITDINAEQSGSCMPVISKIESDNGLCVDYTVSADMTEDMKSELEEYARAGTQAYIYYTTLHSIPVSTVLPYIHPKAALYKNIQHFDNTWSNSRTKDEFTSFDIYDFVYYTDERAACSVSATYRLYKYSQIRDFDFDFKLYFIKEDDRWYITSMERILTDK